MSTTSAVLIAVLCLLFIFTLAFLIIRKIKRKSASVDFVNQQVYVGNLPYHIKEDTLRDYFARFGSIQSVRIIRNARTGRSKGYAFVTYGIEQEADAALEAHGKDIAGRTMVVRIAKPRRETTEA